MAGACFVTPSLCYVAYVVETVVGKKIVLVGMIVVNSSRVKYMYVHVVSIV